MIPQELVAAIARLMREMPRNPTAIEVNEALELALDAQSNQSLDKANKATFDKKTAYYNHDKATD
jgi:hypothetical protein